LLHYRLCFKLIAPGLAEPGPRFDFAPRVFPSKVQQYVSSVADGEPLGSSVWGMLAVTASGDTLASYCSGRKMLPASNMKLITTGSALYSLGPDYRFETRLGYSGVIRGGVLHGDLYIIGRGDPTLGSQDQFSQNIDSVFAQWVSILREAGIHKIHGHIVGDGRYYDGSPENGSWAYDDIGTYYGAGGNGLAFFRDRQDFRVSAGDAVGASVNVSVDYPLTPWVSYVYPCVTAPSGTGDNLYLFTTDLSPAAQIRGTFAIDHAPRVEECSNKYPALTCAYHFCSFLENNAVKVTKGPADIDVLGNIRSLRNFHPLKGRENRPSQLLSRTVSPSSDAPSHRPSRRSST
jgi:D-alanyl-D-alanine carboxypeptidase/D-alanyl-D-alanine-endopeptidase (penicillin-binding protein 4)